MTNNIRAVIGGALLLCLSSCVSPKAEFKNASDFNPKPARIEAQTTDYFGTLLEDPYQWMEKKENAEEVKQWMLGQASVVDSVSDSDPMRDRIYQRLAELDKTTESNYFVQRTDNYTFFMAADADTQTPVLMVEPVGGKKRVLLDAKDFKKTDGQQVAIDNYSPSPDGKIVAFNLSSGGGELTDILFIDVETGELLKDKLTWIWGEFDAK